MTTRALVDVPSGRVPSVDTPDPRDPRITRVSLNQKTTDGWALEDLVAGCVDAGVPAVGLWREPVSDYGVERAARLMRSSGLRVSSLCRGGFLTATDGTARDTARESNRRAIDEAAALDAACLVMVVGGLPVGDTDLVAARTRMADEIAELVPHAQANGVRLALEPMHPIYCADRGVLSTLGQSLDLAEQFDTAHVGVVVDTFHVWWDPDLETQIRRAGDRIASFQVCDWITPLPADTLLARGMMGDGHIDFRTIAAMVGEAGYTGDVEVEIFNADVWAADPRDVLDTLLRRYVSVVA